MSKRKSIFVINRDKNEDEKYKICTICGIAKFIDEIYSTDSRCKKCKIVYNKERRHFKNEQLKLYKNFSRFIIFIYYNNS